MGRSRSWCENVLAVFLVMVLWLSSQSSAQQGYPQKDGYSCSNSGKKVCSAFALYRAQKSYNNTSSVAKLLGANANQVAKLSKVAVNQSLDIGRALIVPITCRCGINDTSYANISYTIVSKDTFYNLATMNFEDLSTTTEVVNVNSNLVPTDLQIGQKIVFPVRCACPSTSQISSGVTALVTYPLADQDTVDEVGASFGVASEVIMTANGLGVGNSQINAQTTLLVPINSSQPVYTAQTLPAAPGSSSSPSPAPVSPSSGHRSSSNNTGLYVAIAVGVCGAILILFAAALCTRLALRRKRMTKSRGRYDSESPLVPTKSNIGSSPGISSSNNSNKNAPGHPLAVMSDLVGSDKPTLFTYGELSDATNNFSDSSKLQGSVYRGILNGRVVAIKQMKGNVSQELKILCRVHHTNLVKLVGLCVKEAEHLYLVYEYAENGSLSDCLHTDILSQNKLSTQSSSFLSWTMRVQIALDAACGLEYIHDYVNPSYVHKDVKSSNILLDGAFRAKIANFAMAKSGGNNDMMTRHIAGTYGYMAPEYLAHGLVSTKADVFSFGVVLLELLSGNEAISEDADGQEKCLYESIKPILESADPAASLQSWMDPVLESNYAMDTALNMAALAKSCVDMDPSLRPSMKDITFILSKLLNACLEWETSSVFASTLAETPIEAR